MHSTFPAHHNDSDDDDDDDDDDDEEETVQSTFPVGDEDEEEVEQTDDGRQLVSQTTIHANNINLLLQKTLHIQIHQIPQNLCFSDHRLT